MRVIDRFHRMEFENSLFDLDNKENLPLWDIIRYNVYLKYYYPEKDRSRFEKEKKHTLSEYFHLGKMLFFFAYNLLFYKSKNVFFTASRYVDDFGRYFDKSAQALIDFTEGDCLIMEPILGVKMKNPFLYDFSNVLRRFYNKKSLNINDFEAIKKALETEFKECLVTYEEINRMLLNFKVDYFFYKWFFFFKKTKKIFISLGNPRAVIMAAKQFNIVTFLVQHASIEFDSIDLSYPQSISPDSRILFSDYVLTYGDFWCKNFNVPAKEIITIGNDYFFNKPNLVCNNSILIVSTIIHGGELKELTRRMAIKRKDLNFVYKLHPNEFSYVEEYISFFIENTNVKIITDQVDTSTLISQSSLVVLIVSTVVYEALNQQKKVAIYKKINFERQLHLLECPNIYFFNNEDEAFGILDQEVISNESNYYKQTDLLSIKRIFE